MIRSLYTWLTSLVFAGLLTNSAFAVDAVSSDPIDAIDRAFDEGRISRDEQVRLLFDAVTDATKLPDQFKADGALSTRCGTATLLQALRDAKELSPETQVYLKADYERPERQVAYDSPLGFFKLHYDTIGDHAVPLADLDANDVPDFVDRCVAYLDTSRVAHLDMGYIMPPSDDTLGGDSLFDIYFSDILVIGTAYPEGDGPAAGNDAFSHLVLNHNFVGMSVNEDPEGNEAGAAKIGASHEFHHCVQFAYDHDEFIWFMELDATHVEDIIYDQIDDNHAFLPLFFNSPQTSLKTTTTHMYASFVWAMFLAERFDTTLVRAAWEGATETGVDVHAALNDTLLAREGVSLEDAFAEFCAWNYITGSRDDGLHYLEGGDYPSVSLYTEHSIFPVNWTASTVHPEAFASAYVKFNVSALTARLRVSFDGSDAADWRAALVLSQAPTVHEIVAIDLAAGSWDGEYIVDGIDDYTTVVLVAVNVSESGGGAQFNYRAERVSPYEVDVRMVSDDTLIYSGGLREIQYKVVNTSTMGDVYDLFAWDDNGWVAPDTLDLFAPAGGEAVRVAQVQPPVGTPVGTINEYYVGAVSHSDPTVADTLMSFVVTVLQLGDVNFDGIIDIGDLTHMINYLFLFGDEPLPVLESGNFDCEGDVDIGDLTGIIQYLFISFQNSSCQPF